MQDDIDKFKSEGVDVEEERKAILRKLEDDLNKASKSCVEYDITYKGTHKIIEQLKDGQFVFNFSFYQLQLWYPP